VWWRSWIWWSWRVWAHSKTRARHTVAQRPWHSTLAVKGGAQTVLTVLHRGFGRQSAASHGRRRARHRRQLHVATRKPVHAGAQCFNGAASDRTSKTTKTTNCPCTPPNPHIYSFNPPSPPAPSRASSPLALLTHPAADAGKARPFAASAPKCAASALACATSGLGGMPSSRNIAWQSAVIEAASILKATRTDAERQAKTHAGTRRDTRHRNNGHTHTQEHDAARRYTREGDSFPPETRNSDARCVPVKGASLVLPSPSSLFFFSPLPAPPP